MNDQKPGDLQQLTVITPESQESQHKQATSLRAAPDGDLSTPGAVPRSQASAREAAASRLTHCWRESLVCGYRLGLVRCSLAVAGPSLRSSGLP